MSAKLSLDVAGMHFEARLDDAGITLVRGTWQQIVPWNQVTGALILREESKAYSINDVPPQIVQRYGGEEAIATLLQAATCMGRVMVAYRDGAGKKHQIDVPFDKSDPSIVNEFQTRLGNRWLGDAKDQREAQKKLKLAPGCFSLAFGMIIVLLLIAVGGALLLLNLLGPALNLLSIQRMLLNLQDGDYASFGTSLLVYVSLFVLAYLGHRVWHARVAMRRRSAAGPFPHLPPH